MSCEIEQSPRRTKRVAHRLSRVRGEHEDSARSRGKNHRKKQSREHPLFRQTITKQLQNNHKNSIQSQTIAALDVSRELAYLSTASDVSRLNFRVRNESGCDPAAMAAIEDFFTGTLNLNKKYHTRYNITDFVWILTDIYQLLNYRTLVSVD